MVKTVPSSARGEGLIPGQGAKIVCLTAKKPHMKNTSSILTN